MACKLTASENLFRRAEKHIPRGVNSPVRYFDPYPFFVGKAKGAIIWDVEGRAFHDFVMGYGALLFGHAYPPLVDALRDQVEDGTLYGAPTEAEVELAEKLSEVYPSLEMSRAVNSGTEATMHALRAARAYTGKNKIVKFDGCFHGSHDSVLVKAGSGASTFGVPSSKGGIPGAAEHTLIARYNDADSVRKAIKSTDEDVAAVIVEPVIANYGLILPEEGFLKELREICDQYSTILIFDEIVTGFRLGKGGAQRYYAVTPDMTTLGKVLGLGLPIAVYGGRSDIMQNIAPLGQVYQAGTFSGNPLSVRAALKALEFTNPDVYTRASSFTRRLVSELNGIIEENHVNATVNSLESMFQVFLGVDSVRTVDDARRADTGLFKKLFAHALSNGVFTPPSQFETNFVSAVHDESSAQAYLNAFQGWVRGESRSG